MQGCWRTSGAWSTFGIIASLMIFGCTGNLPNGSTGTGGAVLSGVPTVHRATATVCSGELADAGVPTSVYDGGSTGPTGSRPRPPACTTSSAR